MFFLIFIQPFFLLHLIFLESFAVPAVMGGLLSLSLSSCNDDITLPSAAKLQLVTGWTPHLNGKGGGVHRGRGRGWWWDYTDMGLTEKKKERRHGFWAKRFGEGERKGVVIERGTDEGCWVCPHLL